MTLYETAGTRTMDTANEALRVRLYDAVAKYAVEMQIEDGVSPDKVHPPYLIEATRRIERIAEKLQTDAVKTMRSDDHDWYAVASIVLDMNLNAVNYGNAVYAFELVADVEADGGATISWQCNECHKMITDYGPYSSNPDINERGHEQDCPRHAAAQLFYETRTDSHD